ncbi:helix-turn-helix domain-containing protein [Bacillus sinesaloumensis]|uniref:helix-turn-helix domain-containing protein n=1 Tax=Litchfieldia sinesaloumensis TaxID=1926280 RepID=UPI0009888D92|nr:helix-turn-helix transcriptional regulator [Bacillus sinesaloumensis]
MREIVGLRIRKLRKKRKWSQKELAERVTISKTYMGMIERAEAGNISYDILTKIATALDVTIEEFGRNTDLIEENNAHRLLLAEYMDMLQQLDPVLLKELIKVTPHLLESFKYIRSMK